MPHPVNGLGVYKTYLSRSLVYSCALHTHTTYPTHTQTHTHRQPRGGTRSSWCPPAAASARPVSSPSHPLSSEDRIHGPGCPCKTGANPTVTVQNKFLLRCTQTWCVFPYSSEVACAKVIPYTIRSSMQHDRFLHSLRPRNRRH